MKNKRKRKLELKDISELRKKDLNQGDLVLLVGHERSHDWGYKDISLALYFNDIPFGIDVYDDEIYFCPDSNGRLERANFRFTLSSNGLLHPGPNIKIDKYCNLSQEFEMS
jgi:hypothetical protein